MLLGGAISRSFAGFTQWRTLAGTLAMREHFYNALLQTNTNHPFNAQFSNDIIISMITKVIVEICKL